MWLSVLLLPVAFCAATPAACASGQSLGQYDSEGECHEALGSFKQKNPPLALLTECVAKPDTKKWDLNLLDR